MELLDLLDSSVASLVNELKFLRQENEELQNQASSFSLVVTDVERLRLDNESLKAQSLIDAQINADNANLQLNINKLQVDNEKMQFDNKKLQLEGEKLQIDNGKLQVDGKKLQVDNERLYKVVDELDAKNAVQQSEFSLLKNELVQWHKVKDIVLNKVNILLTRLKEIKDVN